MQCSSEKVESFSFEKKLSQIKRLDEKITTIWDKIEELVFIIKRHHNHIKILTKVSKSDHL